MADQNISDLAAVTAPLDTDLAVIETDPAGSPITKKCTILDLLREGYGEISVTAGAGTQTLTGGSTWDKITQFDTDGVSKQTTNDNANDKITLTDAGTWVAVWQVTWTGAAGQYDLAVWHNGAQVGGIVQHTSPGTDEEHATVVAIFSAAAAQDLECRVKGSGSILFDVKESNLIAVRIGG